MPDWVCALFATAWLTSGEPNITDVMSLLYDACLLPECSIGVVMHRMQISLPPHDGEEVRKAFRCLSCSFEARGDGWQKCRRRSLGLLGSKTEFATALFQFQVDA